jgi:hypothetical protein
LISQAGVPSIATISSSATQRLEKAYDPSGSSPLGTVSSC